MNEYSIDVSRIEELQMLADIKELEKTFAKAHSTIVQGEHVVLLRKNPDGTSYKFDELTTEADLKSYRNIVFKYLR